MLIQLTSKKVFRESKYSNQNISHVPVLFFDTVITPFSECVMTDEMYGIKIKICLGNENENFNRIYQYIWTIFERYSSQINMLIN